MNKTYTVIDGIPTINPRLANGQPMNMSEEEFQQKCAEFERLREEFWAGKPPEARRRPNGSLTPLPHDPSYK